jgi:hypothetical protein
MAHLDLVGRVSSGDLWLPTARRVLWERGVGLSSGDLWQCCRYCWQHCPRLASGHPDPALSCQGAVER